MGSSTATIEHDQKHFKIILIVIDITVLSCQITVIDITVLSCQISIIVIDITVLI